MEDYLSMRFLRFQHNTFALCKSGYESIRLVALTNPVAIILNGIDLPESPCLERNKSNKILLKDLKRLLPLNV